MLRKKPATSPDGSSTSGSNGKPSARPKKAARRYQRSQHKPKPLLVTAAARSTPESTAVKRNAVCPQDRRCHAWPAASVTPGPFGAGPSNKRADQARRVLYPKSRRCRLPRSRNPTDTGTYTRGFDGADRTRCRASRQRLPLGRGLHDEAPVFEGPPPFTPVMMRLAPDRRSSSSPSSFRTAGHRGVGRSRQSLGLRVHRGARMAACVSGPSSTQAMFARSGRRR